MSDVRRCRSCGEAAAIAVRDWEGTTFLGLVKTGRAPRQDFVCQACGVGFTIDSPGLKLFMAVTLGPSFGALGLLLAVAGLAVLFENPVYGLLLGGFGVGLTIASGALVVSGFRPMWTHRTRPVLPDAPVPELRFRLTEPVRRCSCGAAVPCHGVTDNRTNGIHTGTEWEYICPSCERRFVVESALGQFSTVFASSVAVAIGLLMLSTAPGQGAGAWLCSGAIALLGVCGYLLALFRLIARFRFPVLPQSQLGGAPASGR